jgi:hypothetical protein
VNEEIDLRIKALEFYVRKMTLTLIANRGFAASIRLLAAP